MTTKKYDEGKTIIEEGDSFRAEKDSVYWIAKGQVEVWKGGHFMTLLGEGEVFGDLAAFGTGARKATVKSKTKVVLRMVRGIALHEVLHMHEDEALMAKWEEAMEQKMEQLTHKETLQTQMKHKPVHLDFMFMKLPSMQQDGTRMPTNEPMDAALYDACNLLDNGLPKLPPKDPLAALKSMY